MLAVFLGWAFASFIYFKISFDFALRDISIIASLLLYLLLAASVYIASGIYSARLLPFTTGMKSPNVSILLNLTILPFIGVFAAYTLLGRLIMFGFSKQLDRFIDLTDFRGGMDEIFIVFLIIMFFPVFIHYVMCLFPLLVDQNK
jgi:hypothetical protein